MLRIILILIIVGVFAVTGVYLVQRVRTIGGLVQSAQDPAPSRVKQNPNPPIIELLKKDVFISITENGFSPSEVQVQIYTEVIFQNDTASALRIEIINPADNTIEFAREILQGAQVVFEPYFTREYRFYTANNPAQTGKIIVD